MATRKEPNPIDVHVGGRLKMRRSMLGMTQEKLGEQLGVTFQQIQKYEKGANRIGASRLQEIARILDVPVSFFFEDATQALDRGAMAPGMADDGAPGFAISPGAFGAAKHEPTGSGSEAHALARAFSEIPDARLRRRIIDLVETLADAHRR